MSQALYRQYRPLDLGGVVGQEHITDTLTHAISAGRISHAYLFTGPRGVGKTSVARILAHQINAVPYGQGQHLDIIEIDAASNRRIDDIRDLRDKVHIAPVSAKYKVYIIDEVHMLTGESFNALLKTLEEPPAHVVFILATTESHKLPATIVSRTQRFNFKPVSQEKVISHLRHIAEKEHITISDDALALIAEHGEGSFRDSISLLDQLAHTSPDGITATAVVAAVGLAPEAQLQQLIGSLLSGDRSSVATQLRQLETAGATPAILAMQLGKALAEQALTKPHLYEIVESLLDVPRAYNPSLKLLTVLMRAISSPASQVTATIKPPMEPKTSPRPTPAKKIPASSPGGGKEGSRTNDGRATIALERPKK